MCTPSTMPTGAYAAGWYKRRDAVRSTSSLSGLRGGVGAYGIAMELAKEDLQKVIYTPRPTKSSETQVALFVAGLFFGLRDMHARGVLHCDLKPANVLVVPVDGTDLFVAKIADLGSACCEDTHSDRSFDCSSWNLPPCTEARPGTRRYWAPEKNNGAMNTFATDVFSAGLVVHEMLSASNGPDSVTFEGLLDDVSQLRIDAESNRGRQELNLSIAIPYTVVEAPLRELIRCTLAPDPEVRCDIEGASLFAARMLAAVQIDSDRIFEAQLANKRLCAGQHGAGHPALGTGSKLRAAAKEFVP